MNGPSVMDGRTGPCKDCPDRYFACSDHCRKPEYLKWREELKMIKENRKKYICPIWKYGDRDGRKG